MGIPGTKETRAAAAWWVREKPYWNAGLWALGMAFFVLYFFFKEITVKAS